MSLIKWNPFLSDGFGFDDADKIMGEFLPAVSNNRAGFTPALDIYEDNNNIIVETQLAGIDPEKVSISIENNILYIKGESERKSEVEEKNYYRKEIKRGSFYRSISLPEKVKGDEATAITEDGILKISVPKVSEVNAKNIKIQIVKKK
ncbi:MAG: Hsp20/alpha crystallin family protein [Patescibacteria group bacterium]|nr:Hsp20/alpha crystallin family protein [Patescibacteria group bacterium]